MSRGVLSPGCRGTYGATARAAHLASAVIWAAAARSEPACLDRCSSLCHPRRAESPIFTMLTLATAFSWWFHLAQHSRLQRRFRERQPTPSRHYGGSRWRRKHRSHVSLVLRENEVLPHYHRQLWWNRHRRVFLHICPCGLFLDTAAGVDNNKTCSLASLCCGFTENAC